MDGISDEFSQVPLTLDGATSGVNWGDFFNGAGGLVDKYLTYRIAKTGDAKGADGQLQTVIAGQAIPSWVGPAALLGGIGLVVYLVLRR